VKDRNSYGATRDYPRGQPSGAFLGSAPSYPLVITGGGALPLPMSYCAQPAMLKRANIAAIPRESFFMKATPITTTDVTPGFMALKSKEVVTPESLIQCLT
jgi:hypothetical protein